MGKKVGAIGISGMMHGYPAFDKNNRLLTPFRTRRTTTVGGAWGTALLAAYMMKQKTASLCNVFGSMKKATLMPDTEGFDRYFDLYQFGLAMFRTE